MTIAEDLVEMSKNWAKIEARVRDQHPELSKDELFAVVREIFERSLGIHDRMTKARASVA